MADSSHQKKVGLGAGSSTSKPNPKNSSPTTVKKFRCKLQEQDLSRKKISLTARNNSSGSNRRVLRQVSFSRIQQPSASCLRETMNSRIKSQNKDSKIPEYQYFKEKKLLEFLTLKGKEHTKQQQEIKQKLGMIQEQNRFIEDEKLNLLEKLNDFNPLNTKEIQTYLD